MSKGPKKSLGQHWLTNPQALEAITEAAELTKRHTVLEIGPGLGTLTAYLVQQAGHVVAVELDEKLASELAWRITAPNLQIATGDILKFDLNALPAGYKVVANIPYYLTSILLRVLAESPNPPSAMVLLVQKEVAERIVAKPGQMSVLSVSVQLYYDAEAGLVVPAKLFNPPPKVDSQVVMLHRHAKPLFHDLDTKIFFKLIKTGFSAKRKKLANSLEAGLQLEKEQVNTMLKAAGVKSELRAQNLTLEAWHRLYLAYKKMIPTLP